MKYTPENVAAEQKRFRKLIKKGKGKDACWIFSSLGSNKYGVFSSYIPKKHSIAAHRYAYELATGTKIPPGMCVLHQCDQRGCTRPSHLRLGTAKDNSADMVAKGRNKGPRKPNNPFTDAERGLIAKMHSDGATVYAIQKALPHRAYTAIRDHIRKKVATKVTIIDGLHKLHAVLSAFTKNPELNNTIATPPQCITPTRVDSTKIVILPANREWEAKSA